MVRHGQRSGNRSEPDELSHLELNWIVSAVDKNIDRIVGEIFRGRPRNEVSAMRPKQNGRVVPVSVGTKGDQGLTKVVYVLPSWRKKLKGQLADNVRVAQKFHPVQRAGVAGTNDEQIIAGAHHALPLASGKPAIKPVSYTHLTLPTKA